MNTHLLYETNPARRVRWVFDEDYQTHGSYCYDTEEETQAAESYEYDMLNRGEWVALGCIIERKCPMCEEWHHADSVWGIVIEPDTATLKAYEEDTWRR